MKREDRGHYLSTDKRASIMTTELIASGISRREVEELFNDTNGFSKRNQSH